MSYLKNLIRTTGNEFASIVEEGVAAADVSGYIDTGSYIFNALLLELSFRILEIKIKGLFSASRGVM